VVHLDPLDVETLRLILTQPRNALLKQYQQLFAMEGIQLELTEDAIAFIAEKALEYKLGARGLRSLCEAILTDAMFDPNEGATNHTLVIDRAYAEDKLSRSRLSKLKAA
jgi:ATP-dependent Clp protease ATP-binding subunit ClpX